MSDLKLSQKESIAISDDSKYFKRWTDTIIWGKGNFRGVARGWGRGNGFHWRQGMCFLSLNTNNFLICNRLCSTTLFPEQTRVNI